MVFPCPRLPIIGGRSDGVVRALRERVLNKALARGYERPEGCGLLRTIPVMIDQLFKLVPQSVRKTPETTSKEQTLMRLRFVSFLLAFLLTALFAGGASTVRAQTETGRITGLVIDQTGGVLPGVTITVTSLGSGAVRATT